MREDQPAQWWETRRFALTAIGVSALPLMWPPLPPMPDLPGHMARYHVMLGQDAGILDQWYRFAWRPIGNIGADLIVAALAPLVGLEPAVKLLAIAVAMLAAAGILWISREAHGRVQPLALFALPLAYHFAFLGGYINFALATALALNGFALWLRLGRQHRWRLRAMLFVPLSCIVWTAHLFGWIMLGVLAFCAEFARQRGDGRPWFAAGWYAGLGCLPLALPTLMFVIWRPSDGNARSDYLESLVHKPGWLAMVLRDRWAALDIGATAIIFILIYRAIRSPARVVAAPIAAAAIGLFALFMILPFGSANLDARIAPFVLMLALLAFGTAPSSTTTAARLAALGLVFFLARTAATTASLAIESNEWQRQLRALDHIPRGTRVAAFVTNRCPQQWSIGKSNHIPSMAVVRRAAFINDQFDPGTTSLLHIVAPGLGVYAADPSQIVTDGPCAAAREIRPLAERLAGLPRDRFDYVWLIAAPPDVDPRLLRGFVPIWRDGGDVLLRIDRRPLSVATGLH